MNKILLVALLLISGAVSAQWPGYTTRPVSVGGSGVSPGGTAIGCTNYAILRVDGTPVIVCDGSFTFGGSAAGKGLASSAGTAVTAVSGGSFTQTWNNAAITFPGYTFQCIDTASGASSLCFSVMGGSTGATNLFKVDKTGIVTAGGNKFNTPGSMSLTINTTEAVRLSTSFFDIGAIPLTGGNAVGVRDVGFTRSAANTWACGNGTTGDKTCTFQLANMQLTGTMIAAAGLTAASGTPGSICYNTSTNEITKNNALTCTVSSARFKDNMRAYTVSGLSVLARLKPTTFTYKDHPERPRIGFIAEELNAVDPRLSEHEADGTPNSIDFPAVLAVLVKAGQELQDEVDSVRVELRALKAANLAQTRRLNIYRMEAKHKNEEHVYAECMITPKNYKGQMQPYICGYSPKAAR